MNSLWRFLGLASEKTQLDNESFRKFCHLDKHHQQHGRTAPVWKSCLTTSLCRLVGTMTHSEFCRRILIQLICMIEGGLPNSSTYRKLMVYHYNVDIGRESYGECLGPGRLPPGTSVGNYCSLANGIVVFRRDHPISRVSQHPFFYNSLMGGVKKDTIPPNEDNPLRIGHDVWIGYGVIITSHCSAIETGSVIAAGSVVTRNVPAFAIVGGVPAKIIRFRFSEDVQKSLLRSSWWLRSREDLIPYMSLFLIDATLDVAERLEDVYGVSDSKSNQFESNEAEAF